MEAYTKIKSFHLADPLSDEDEKRLREAFPNEEDLRLISYSGMEIEMEFNTYLYSGTDVARLLETEGFALVKEKKSGFLIKKLEEMAESNKKNLGNQKLDCCRLPK